MIQDTSYYKPSNTTTSPAFDETEKYFRSNKNRVFTVLFGDAIPTALIGTTDDTNYNHYSNLATVEKNWDLSTLPGPRRGDADANAFYAFNGEGYVNEDKFDVPRVVNH